MENEAVISHFAKWCFPLKRKLEMFNRPQIWKTKIKMNILMYISLI